MVLSNKEWLDKMDEIISAIQNNGVDSQVIMDMLSNMWSSSVTYNVGDYVLYNNNIWKCLIQNSNIAPTEGSTWTSVKITNEISTLNSNLSKKIISSISSIDVVNLNQYGYADISSYKPNIDGYSILNANIDFWSSGNPYNVTSDGTYLIGPPSSQVGFLRIKYIFIKND